MIELIPNGDIFAEPLSEMLVNPVNVVGSMGAGLAKAFRERYPGIWTPYYNKCRAGWDLGTVLTLKNPGDVLPMWIVCCPTKKHWSAPSSLLLVKKSLGGLIEEIAYTGVKSVSVPALGAGLGQIPWNQVKSLLTSDIWPEFVHVRIFEPHNQIQK